MMVMKNNINMKRLKGQAPPKKKIKNWKKLDEKRGNSTKEQERKKKEKRERKNNKKITNKRKKGRENRKKEINVKMGKENEIE